MNKVTLSDMAIFSMCLRNDFHFLHLHISGPNFLELHEMLGEYYDKALEYFDYFSEHAIANKEKIVNMNEAFDTEAFNKWESVPYKDTITENELIDILRRIGNDYLEALDLCRDNAPDFIQSDIDEMSSYIDTEINYKNEQRGK